MPSITFNYSVTTAALFQEANDLANEQEQRDPPLTPKQRAREVLIRWIKVALVQKERMADTEDLVAKGRVWDRDVDFS